MTLTIDLSPTEQARLTAAARQTGLEPAALAKRLVTEHLPNEEKNAGSALDTRDRSEQERIAAILAARGSMAYVGVTVDDLHRERQADKQKEEQSSIGNRS